MEEHAQHIDEIEEDPFEDMSRDDLEVFAREAGKKLAELEMALDQLRASAKANSHVDPDVIDRWRGWIDTLEEERKGWADMATRLSTDSRQLEARVEGLEYALRETAGTLEFVVGAAEKSISDSKRVTSCKRVLQKISDKSTEMVTSLYEHFLGWPGDEVREGGSNGASNDDEDAGDEGVDEDTPEMTISDGEHVDAS